MRVVLGRVVVVAAGLFAFLSLGVVVSPGISGATECGVGTVYDPPSNTCVAANPAPPAPAPPPPHGGWNGDLTPYFSVGICAPIPFVSLCTGI